MSVKLREIIVSLMAGATNSIVTTAFVIGVTWLLGVTMPFNTGVLLLSLIHI